jgi:predicted flap endonuclease-1-like 5' DNA nuclease
MSYPSPHKNGNPKSGLLRTIFFGSAGERRDAAIWWALVGFILGAQLVLLWIWLRRRPGLRRTRPASAEPSLWHPSPVEVELEPGPSVIQREAPPTPEQPASAGAIADEDLVIIEGIGPKVSNLLKGAGIRTYQQLAETAVERLQSLLKQAKLPMIDPSTWPEQAELAAHRDWAGLQKLQERLRGGRRRG